MKTSPATTVLNGSIGVITFSAVTEEVTYEFHETPRQKLPEWRGGILKIEIDGISEVLRVYIPWQGFDEDIRKSFLISVYNDRGSAAESDTSPEEIDIIARTLLYQLPYGRRDPLQKAINLHQIAPELFTVNRRAITSAA